MLPTMILQFSDTALFDNSVNSAKMLPDELSQDDISFAAFFESGLETAPTVEDISGALLPPSGNQLPAEGFERINVSLFSGAAEGSVSPSEIAASLVTGKQPGIEPPGIEQPGIEPIVFASGPDMPAVTAQGAMAGGQATLQSLQMAIGSPVPVTIDDIEISLGEHARGHKQTAAPDAGLMRQLAMSETATPATRLAPPFDTQSQSNGMPEIRSPQPPVASSPAAQALLAAATSSESPLVHTPQTSESPIVHTLQTSVLTATPQLLQVAASSGAESSPLLPTVDVPVKSAGWAQQIGERVLLMTNNRLQSAEIRLTPAELGPVRIQLAVDDGAASVTFLAQNAITREAIEQAMPRLRDLLAENGLNLGQSDVSEHGANGDAGVRQGEEGRDDVGTEADASLDGKDDSLQPGPAAAPATALSYDGLVDTFA